MAEEEVIHRGLAGVVADTTAISMVDPTSNSLLYRGYPVQELAASCSFEEVAYLIWHGELPNKDELSEFVNRERSRRSLDASLMSALSRLPELAHPMDVLRTATSWLGACDPRPQETSAEANLARSIDLMAKLPTVVAFSLRRRRGLDPIPPEPALSFAENFFLVCFGTVPEPEIVKSFEISLILYAEHSFNASTFAARVIASTLADLHGAVTGAIAALKGPLHGGANEAVMEMMAEIGTADRAVAWLDQALAEKRKIMGFGHRVYKHGDSRVPTMYAAFQQVAAARDGAELLAIYEALAARMLELKNIYPNLDYPAGPAYHLMGFDTPIFTPIFVTARITGWTAHVIEQLENNSLIRPLSSYVGPPERHVER